MPRLCLPILLIATLAVSAAHAGPDPRYGVWTCRYGGADFGTFRPGASGYSFENRLPGGASSSGGLRWESDSFWLVGGALTAVGVTSGALYQLPDAPDEQGLDLYSDMGVIARCRR